MIFEKNSVRFYWFFPVPCSLFPVPCSLFPVPCSLFPTSTLLIQKSNRIPICNVGIETIHVSEIGLSAAEDAEIIQRAKEEERVVVTLDADFHTLLAFYEATSPSVIRIRIQRLRSQALTDLLIKVINECQEELQQGAAVTVEPNRIRIRHLPLLLDV